jgi:ubiquinone/menaquinone biosynthesis C-methylase UbiE
MHLKDLQRHWHEFGRRDPLWAILTLPDKRNAGWKTDEFFQTGRDEIAQILAHVDRLGLSRPTRRALDFGCGVGRLTQALCEQVGVACGVDIAPSMVEQARQHNRHGARCEYVVNDADDLGRFADDSFDFVYSSRVLQHMRPTYSTRYIREFLRVLSPGGVAVFQIPTAPRPVAAGEMATAASITAHALPEAAYRARIAPRVAEISGAPGAAITIRVEVSNMSPLSWPCARLATTPHPITLGNHWRSGDGHLLALDDGRTLLSEDLVPDAAVELALTVNLPPEGGVYRLELDLVHDWVTWFADKGSPPAQLTACAQVPLAARTRALARKLRGRVAAAASGEVVVPVMEMYRVPEETIADLVVAAGGTIADRVPDCSGGEDWPGFVFYVVKQRRP